jgi:phosphomannomutase
MLRPSGTEPKIKYYFDVVETVRSDEAIADARGRGEKVLGALVEAFLADLEARKK